MRRMRGICPPSKPMRIELPERAVCPLPPRPLVLPWPLDSPWPRRLRRCLAPGRGLRSCKRMGKSDGDRWSLRRFLLLLLLLLLLQRESAALVDVFAPAKLLESRQRGLDHVGRI